MIKIDLNNIKKDRQRFARDIIDFFNVLVEEKSWEGIWGDTRFLNAEADKEAILLGHYMMCINAETISAVRWALDILEEADRESEEIKRLRRSNENL